MSSNLDNFLVKVIYYIYLASTNRTFLFFQYITICSAEHFILPQSLHKYCGEVEQPEQQSTTTTTTTTTTSHISLHELQMYLYFNQLRYMQQSGQRVSSLTREEVDSDAVSEVRAAICCFMNCINLLTTYRKLWSGFVSTRRRLKRYWDPLFRQQVNIG